MTLVYEPLLDVTYYLKAALSNHGQYYQPFMKLYYWIAVTLKGPIYQLITVCVKDSQK